MEISFNGYLYYRKVASPLLQDFVQSLIYPAVQCEKQDHIIC